MGSRKEHVFGLFRREKIGDAGLIQQVKLRMGASYDVCVAFFGKASDDCAPYKSSVACNVNF